MRHIIQTGLIALAIVAGVSLAESCAKADPGLPNCETIGWGLFNSQRRTICDGPIQPDGSWTRARGIWVPAHQVPITCSGSRYFTSCSGGNFVGDRLIDQQTYPVNPAIVLPDEPGHLGFNVA